MQSPWLIVTIVVGLVANGPVVSPAAAGTDRDDDRILDADDQCPDDPETYNGITDIDGCPDQGTVVVNRDPIAIIDRIHFASRSARVTKVTISMSSNRAKRW